jgi:HEAT repeat protein
MKRGRRFALVAIASGVAVLGAAAVALREPLLETWWLHRLESEDPGAQRAAAEGLGRIGSLKAIGPLLAKTRDPHHGYMAVHTSAISGLAMIVAKRGKAAAPFLVEALENETDRTAREVASALLRVAAAPPGTPVREELLHDTFILERQ